MTYKKRTKKKESKHGAKEMDYNPTRLNQGHNYKKAE